MKVEEPDGRSSKKNAKNGNGKKSNWGWVIKISLITIAISMAFSFVSQEVIGSAGIIVACVLLFAFILIGILFDILGTAVTSADERPFHSMAAHKEKGAQQAIRLIRSADKVANICNDVVGDIAGIVSGSTAAVIVARIVGSFALNEMILTLAFSGAVAGLTVGGKAAGKNVAIQQSTKIVHLAGRFIGFFIRSDKKKK